MCAPWPSRRSIHRVPDIPVIRTFAMARYLSCVRHLPTILLLLSFPAGAIGYAVTVKVMTAILPGTSNDLIILLAALFVAGLVMLPFLIPFFDRKAKQDLAAYRADHPDADPGAVPDDTVPDREEAP